MALKGYGLALPLAFLYCALVGISNLPVKVGITEAVGKVLAPHVGNKIARILSYAIELRRCERNYATTVRTPNLVPEPVKGRECI